MTGQVSITQLLSRHRVGWLGHAARKLETAVVNQLLFADSILGRPRLVGHLLYTLMDGAMQDLSTLPATGYSWTTSETGRSAGPGFVEGGCQPVLALPLLLANRPK